MKTQLLTGLAILAALSVSACTDTTRANFGSFGDSRTVECYSGGELIYKGQSTGMVEALPAGVQFVDKSGEFIEIVGAACILKT